MSTDRQISLSVLISTRDRRELLRRCLDSLSVQTADPGSFEVVVVDDGSSDGTEEMLAALETPFRLRTLRLEQSHWIAAARNLGVEACDGEVCLHLDDDVVCSPELVGGHLAAFEADRRTVGVGKLIQALPGSPDWYAETVARGIAEHFEDLAGREADWTDCYGANFSTPRAAFLAVGGFATDLETAIDLELCLRLREAGCVVRYLPEASGVHDDGKLAAGMMRDAAREGRAHVALVDRHPETLPQMLDWRGSAGPLELRLRRVLIAVHCPPGPLIGLGRLVPGWGRRMLWGQFVRRLAFWSAVRRQVTTSRWRQLTGESGA